MPQDLTNRQRASKSWREEICAGKEITYFEHIFKSISHLF